MAPTTRSQSARGAEVLDKNSDHDRPQADDTKSSDNALQGASVGASYGVALQLGFRILTFVVNAIIIRYSSSEMLGVVNVRLTLLYSTVLFVAREPFRKALLSVSQTELESDRDQFRGVINVSWTVVPVGIAVGLLLGLIWSQLLEIPTIDGYNTAVVAYASSAVVELCSEPLWILGQIHSHFRLKVAAEGLSLALRCLISVILVVILPGMGLYGFCIAQMVSCVAVPIVHFVSFWREVSKGEGAFSARDFVDILPKSPQSGHTATWFLELPADMVSRVINFLKQSILKQFLTEGEGYLMTFLGVLSFSEQGTYNIVNNLGSLVARFLFAPIEETFFTYFAGKLRALDDTKTSTIQQDVVEASSTLRTLAKFVGLVSVTIAVFAQPYSALLLELYGGKWLSEGEGPTLLRTYAVYVVFLAGNGLTECFMTASMSNKQIERHNLWMIGFTVVFLLAAWQLSAAFGAVGFILANCVNMGVRTARSCYMIRSYLRRHGTDNVLLSSLPSLTTMCSYAAAFVVCKMSEDILCCTLVLKAGHVGIGVIAVGAVTLVIVLKERQFIQDFRRQLFSKKS